MRIATLLLFCTIGVGATASAQAQSLKPDQVYSSIAVRAISAPNPVQGADGRIHLAYELLVTNPSNLYITLDRVEATDGQGRSLASMDGERLKSMTKPFSVNAAPDVVPPGGMAIVFMDVSFAAGDTLPGKVSGRITATRQVAGPDGKPQKPPAGFPLPVTFSFTGAETGLGHPALVVEPPLRGDRWVAVNGCCDAITSHRGAVMAINGRVRVPERFAIDWVRLDQQDRLFTGDGKKLSDYAYYGTPVHAVAAGTVVNLYNDTDEQVPNSPTKGINTENIGGNMLVIDIGGGNFAFYAHLQRDSLNVGLGDRVTAGQVIGLLGNTGNSSAPHLHFHVMDGPSPLDANGLPYVFTRFVSRGIADLDAPDDPMEKGTPVRIDASRLGGSHSNQLPLNNEVVDFQ